MPRMPLTRGGPDRSSPPATAPLARLVRLRRAPGRAAAGQEADLVGGSASANCSTQGDALSPMRSATPIQSFECRGSEVARSVMICLSVPGDAPPTPQQSPAGDLQRRRAVRPTRVPGRGSASTAGVGRGCPPRCSRASRSA
jgi:hypothetical protein